MESHREQQNQSYVVPKNHRSDATVHSEQPEIILCVSLNKIYVFFEKKKKEIWEHKFKYLCYRSSVMKA